MDQRQGQVVSDLKILGVYSCETPQLCPEGSSGVHYAQGRNPLMLSPVEFCCWHSQSGFSLLFCHLGQKKQKADNCLDLGKGLAQ